MADELMGWNWNFVHMTYSDRWRYANQVFYITSCRIYHLAFAIGNTDVHFISLSNYRLFKGIIIS
jgi:hypothetical protein